MNSWPLLCIVINSEGTIALQFGVLGVSDDLHVAEGSSIPV